jgi:hypothetical protein
MSHANGAVLFPDGLVLWYEYNGTSDVTISHLYDTYDEMRDNWRRSDGLDCICGQDEPVRIACDYGSSHHWPGRACRHCRAITAGRDPYETEMVDELPDWWPISEASGGQVIDVVWRDAPRRLTDRQS